MLAPFNIMKVEPEINANAVHCSITEKRSDKAGIINILVEYGGGGCFLKHSGSKHKD